jgi:DNA-binding XRE family transcriptional regulator/predicted RNase H-like HicB family nuclease
MEYAAIVTREDGALLVEFPGLEGARTEVLPNESLDEMAGEALALWLESELQLRRVPPLPRHLRTPKRVHVRMVRVPAVLSARIQIRQARTAAGLSQSELAKRIGVTQQQIANIESPDGDIRLGTLERAADALELVIDLRLRPKAA